MNPQEFVSIQYFTNISNFYPLCLTPAQKSERPVALNALSIVSSLNKASQAVINIG
jgi:hypothetical protein